MSSVNLGSGQRAQRKLLITVAEWTGASHDIYTIVASQPSSFDPTSYYKKSSSAASGYVLGESGDAWAPNTWYEKSTSTTYREVLGARTEDSSIEFNIDSETSTDILGITYADVNKTEPQQDFDPYYLLGGSELGAYLAEAALDNNIDAYNGMFDVYVIAGFIGGADDGYKAVKHSGCSIFPTAMGGDSYVSMPIEVHYSNNITKGKVDALSDAFNFTPDA